MADRNDQRQHSDEYRPFDDPRHPSWYTDPSTPEPHAAPRPNGSTAVPNPYADQPLAGPYSDGQPQYPVHGGYPVVANQPGAGQNPYGQHHPGAYGHGGMASGRAPGMPYPGAPERRTGLGVTAMVLGIAGILTFGALFVPQILAVVFGHLSLAKEPAARGFALAGLITGYLVIGLWTLLLVSVIAFGMVLV